jgi:hypothetical protein
MGIKLDWEIESERERVRTAGEDPTVRQKRARAFRRLVLFTLLLILIVGGIAWLVGERLRFADEQIRQSLIATVENEVAALRIGDRRTYTDIQRSDNAAWLESQQQLYDAYQTLKTTSNITLSGRVIATEVDGARGRALVEEIIDGIPYGRLWFYFRYTDGWRHVPPDYTFWGEARTVESEGFALRYFAVDEPLAVEVAARVPAWNAAACALLACPTVPTLTVEIVPDDLQLIGWDDNDLWRLRMPSPFTRVARLDAIFTADQQTTLAALLAERLVTITQPIQPTYPVDALYLRQAIISYTVERMTGVETNAFSIDSLATTYGDAAVARLLAGLTADAGMGALAAAAEQPSLDLLTLDWRDLLSWRLALESELIANRNDVSFLPLYDTNDPIVRDLALARYNAGATGEAWVVTEAVRETDALGVPVLRATASVSGTAGERIETVFFRLVDGTWKRAS